MGNVKSTVKKIWNGVKKVGDFFVRLICDGEWRLPITDNSSPTGYPRRNARHVLASNGCHHIADLFDGIEEKAKSGVEREKFERALENGHRMCVDGGWDFIADAFAKALDDDFKCYRSGCTHKVTFDTMCYCANARNRGSHHLNSCCTSPLSIGQ